MKAFDEVTLLAINSGGRAIVPLHFTTALPPTCLKMFPFVPSSAKTHIQLLLPHLQSEIGPHIPSFMVLCH